MHEDHGILAGVLGSFEFTLRPGELRFTQPEVRAASAGGHHVEEKAAMPVRDDGFRQAFRAEHTVESVQRARLEIVVAGQDVKSHRQWGDRIAHEAELLRRAVVGNVAWQRGKIDAASRQTLR